MNLKTPEDELKALDQAIEEQKQLISDEGGFGEVRDRADHGSDEAAVLLEDYEALRMRRELVASKVGGFSQ